MKIILDAMGGDNAPQAVVQGALEAHAQCGADIVLVGREEATGLPDRPPAGGRGDRERYGSGGYVRRSRHRLQAQKGFLPDRGPDHAEKRGGRCLRLRRLHRRSCWRGPPCW